MSHEFDGLDSTEKAGIEGALNRCRALAAQIASELRNKRGKRRGAREVFEAGWCRLMA
jgi:hypothetical protein